ncbi:MAG TPA: hypothetical protein VN112_16190 [Ensifer sp.]|nr:hypothetical protein [Ensifer sp.]
MIPSFFIKPLIGLAVVVAVVIGFMLWLAAHDAAVVASQKAACATEKSDMVSKATFEALQAIADRDRKQAEAAAIAATEAQRRASAAKQSQQAAEARIAALEAEAAQNNALSTVSEEDLKWSGSHH